MCGIAGIWNFQDHTVRSETIKRFTDSMRHRGPDGGNYCLLNNDTLALGHRRLKILDLSEAGNQPMSYGRYTIVYNGEVYNFIELKKELIVKGFAFSTQTDTEVILAAYDHWGKDCLQHFNGMWAMAIWDHEKKELWLARDRFGIKPLYYYHRKDHQFAFASETNAFKELDGFNRRHDDKNLSLAIQDPFLLEGYGKTIYEDIRSVLPGHWISIKQDGAFIEKQWWQTSDHLQDVPEKYDDQVTRFSELFENACRLRLRSDVPIGTALSGGLDSSAVYCMLHHLKHQSFITERLPGQWLKAFSAIFPGTEQDEQHYAAEVVDFAGGEVEWVSQPAYSLADKILSSTKQLDFIYNTPLFMGSDIYESMRKNGMVVSMDGHGVDEMMYGYGFAVKQLADGYVHSNASMAESYWNIYVEMYADKPVQPSGYAEQKKLQQSFPFRLKQSIKKITGITGNKTTNCDILYNQFHYTMLPTILRNFDKMAMRNSIEIRMPFMDWRLVSFVFSLPESSLLGEGFTKRILRDAMKGLMPENVRTRKLKTGLNAPMQSWFGGELKTFLLDAVHSSGFQQNPLWEGKKWVDFVSEKTTKNNWSFDDAISFWPVLNAYILTTSGQ